ncbi:MAG: sensor histidine kinase [Ornithinimicrobium sp.]|uniref:sensor histidine kinase n=1 Tax=Ornithinimicrobium sp. TaxID=1977084 RepID=UPI003D9BE7D0
MSTAAAPPGPATSLRRVAAPLALTVCLLLLMVAGLLVAPADRVEAPLSLTLALAAGFVPMGLFVVRAQPGHLVGRLVLVTGLLALLAVAAVAWSGITVAAWAAQWTWWPPVVVTTLALLVFPDPTVPGGRRRALGILLLVVGTATTLVLAAAAAYAPRGLLTTAQSASAQARPWIVVAVAGAAVVLFGSVLMVLDMIARARRAEPERRSQINCLLPAGGLLVVGIVLDAAGVPLALVPGVLALPIGMGLAIIRYRVDDLDLAVNRSLVWLLMSVAILATFALTVGLLSRTLLADRPLVASAIGTGLVAAGFDPVRRWVQRGVDRLLFGDRSRPQAVVRRLGQRMQLASDPGRMLSRLARTLADSLQVPWVRMLVHGRDGAPVVVAEHGRVQPVAASFAMVAHGEPVGALEVAPRRVGESFTPGEESLLREVAAQAAIAAQAHRLTLELLRAREHLVRAREEERLRLRHDLHDGLGPALAGTRMQLSAARSRVGDDGATRLLDGSLEVLAECTAEVRRLVDGLRPAALDQGLAVALRQRAGMLLSELDAEVRVDDDLGELPAAVEVAAYRIVTEALTNVVKHARAGRCLVRVGREGNELRLLVQDDGRGGAADREGGVGMGSMAQRADEIGGRFVVADAAPGTRIEVVLPLGGAAG